MNNHVIFSWNSDGDGDDDLNKIIRTTNGSRQSSSLVDVVPSTSMAASSAVQPPASDHPPPFITTFSDVFDFWSDIIQPPPPPPPPPLSSLQREEQDQLRELDLFLQQQNFGDPIAGQSTMPFPAHLEQGEPSSSHRVDNAPLMNLECHVHSQRDQEAMPGISIGRTNPSVSDERNKRLKSAQTAHKISEKRRREKMKGKIKALEELLPTCDKKDTASILDEAIKQIKLLKFQAQWMQEQYMSSIVRGVSQPYIPTLPSPLIHAQLMDRTRPNVLGMVPYHAMPHYPAVATMIPRMQMFRMIPPPLFPFTAPSFIAAAPRATLAPRGPPTRVIPNVPEEEEGGGNGGRLASPSSQG